MTDDTIECPCGKRGAWRLTWHAQEDLPQLRDNKLGTEIPVAIEHADGTIHRVEHGGVLG